MSDRGYGSVLALALLFGGILLVGLAADVTRLVAAWREASFVAHTAAEAGAGWVEPEALYAGELVVDVREATRVAEAYAASTGHSAVVDATADRVCVLIETDVKPGVIRLVGARSQAIRVTACAEPRQG